MTFCFRVAAMLVSANVFLALPVCYGSSSGAAARNPQALQLLTSALTALGAGTGQVTSVSLQASVNYQMGGSTYPGTAVLEGVGNTQSRVTLTLPIDSILEIREGVAGVWAGPNGQTQPISSHNCATSSAWFSPHLFLGAAAQNSAYALAYIGAENRNGAAVQHIQIQRTDIFGGSDLGVSLSSIDVYLDATSSLPSSFVFNEHPDENALYNIPVEVQLSGYTASGNVNYPANITKLINGTVLYAFQVTSFTVNPSIPPGDFSF